MRRTNPKPGLGALLLVGDLSLDEQSGDVTRGGRQIRLTVTEFRVLRYLMLNARRVLSKAQIHDNVWPDDNHPWGRYNNVELYISYLRRKIDRGQPKMLHTVRGFGYVLRPPR